MSDPIRGTVEITETDYVEAYVGYAKHAKHVATTWKTIGLVLCVTLFGLISAWPVTPGVWTAMVAALLASIWLSRSQWAWMGRRTFHQLPKARRRYEVALSASGMLAKGPRAEIRYAWSTMVGWIETANLFVLLTPGGVSDVCPKRAFAEGDLPALRALLDEHVVTPPSPTPEVKTKKRGWRTLVMWIFLVAAWIAIYQIVESSR